ncbi:MAG TPA: transcriptional repressor [Desulfurivibrionaceae bacterium]|nr:transcriptional repressor [Desulfurivibrionaceae bacterium]
MTTSPALRNTKQRQIILDALMGVTSHPTADDLYQMVRRRLPRISLGTVYRNLETMAELGLIQKLEVGGTQKRFDGNAATHYHVRCQQCGRVDDLDLALKAEVEQEAAAKTHFTILRHRLEFTGLCPDCQKK